MNMKKLCIPIVTAGLITFALTGLALAHAAIVWAFVENNMIQVEAFYPSGSKIQNAQVIVVDSEGKKILEGTTDKEGKFAYTPVSNEPQTVVVKAGESHVGDFELTEEDLVDLKLD